MKFEYAQTYQNPSTSPKVPLTLTQPEGDGWTLHSWQTAHNNGWLVLIWQREVAAA
jgi:hypothetical protein